MTENYLYFKYFGKYFDIAVNKMIYKLTLLHYPGIWGVTKKGYHNIVFKYWTATPPRTECELNHASKCQTLSATKSKAKRAFLEGNSWER